MRRVRSTGIPRADSSARSGRRSKRQRSGPATRPEPLMVELLSVGWSVTSTTRALSGPAMRRGAWTAASAPGGLVGDNEGGTVTNSYWDTRTSGQGSGSPGSGRTTSQLTTSQLQSPTSYSGIYGSWNVDIDEDNTNDNPWTFGTSSQYPALRADMDGDDDETWAEFGYQLRSGPTLTATTTNAGQSQVELEWTAVPLSSEWPRRRVCPTA